MFALRNKFDKVPARTVVMSLILLVSVLSMGYGYYQHNNVVLYAGVAVAVMAAFNVIMFSVILPGTLKGLGRRD